MLGFIGEYELTLDAKGRISLPTALRKQLPEGQDERFVINRGFEPCLTFYTLAGWEKIARDLEMLNYNNPKAREYKRLFLNGANMVELDSAGRMLLPKSLMAYAGLEKNVVMTAQGDRIEIWDAQAYYKYINERMSGFSDLAQEVAGGDFMKPKE